MRLRLCRCVGCCWAAWRCASGELLAACERSDRIFVVLRPARRGASFVARPHACSNGGVLWESWHFRKGANVITDGLCFLSACACVCVSVRCAQCVRARACARACCFCCAACGWRFLSPMVVASSRRAEVSTRNHASARQHLTRSIEQCAGDVIACAGWEVGKSRAAE